jgi:hypothetical protein
MGYVDSTIRDRPFKTVSSPDDATRHQLSIEEAVGVTQAISLPISPLSPVGWSPTLTSYCTSQIKQGLVVVV